VVAVGHRRREGVALTAGLFAWMLVAAMLRSSVAWPSLAFAVAGLVAAARAWPAMRIPDQPVFRRIVR